MDMSSASGSDCSTRPKSLQGTYTSGLFCLPSDVVLELLSMLTGPELGRLAATCKFFHEHMCHNSLWRTLCRYYGLRDLKYFPGVSFRTVYTRLLYPYGPLIGLWANDRHYVGNLIQFRLFLGTESEEGGIIGCVWSHTPGNPTRIIRHDDYTDGVVAVPQLPTILPFVKIQFARHSKSLSLSNDPDAVVTSCCALEDYRVPHALQLRLVQPSNRAIFLRTYPRWTTPHPHFPPRGVPWYDAERVLPRLDHVTFPEVDQRPLAHILPAAKLPMMFTAPSFDDYLPPIGLEIHCSHEHCLQNRLHRPGHHRQDMLPFSPVYYPVRMPAKEEGRLDPRTELSGIWWADGLPNPQFLYIDWVDTAFDDPSRGGAFMVWKLTGDLLIPRGELLAWLKRDERANSLTPRFEGRGVAITSEARGFSQIQTTATAKLVERDILLIYIAHQNTVLVNDPISCVRIDISNDPHDGGAWIVHS